jgi:DNA-binding transcriptional LysR family regulator
MGLAQLRPFQAAARAGGFNGGARVLHISEPAEVAFPQETYGIQLFHRCARGAQLTTSCSI